VRINPDETHCSDPAFIDDIYPAGGKRRDKPQHQVRALGAWSANIFGCADHDTHRIRRGAVAKFVSRSMVSQLEGDIRALVGRLCDKLLAEQGRGRPIDVTMAYSCLASDIISDYCFGEPFGLLAQKEWTPNFREAGIAVVRPAYYFRFFPFLSHLVALGTWFVDYLPEDMALFIRTLEIEIPALIAKTRAEMNEGVVSSRARPTVFMEVMQSDLPAHEKTPDRLKSEAFSLLGAATEMTSWGLGTITYYLLAQPETMARLRAELEAVVENPRQLPPLTTLERLPYLGAVIQEGLRLSYGVSSRTARIAVNEDLVYYGEFNKKKP
jgi:cytochrome P450